MILLRRFLALSVALLMTTSFTSAARGQTAKAVAASARVAGQVDARQTERLTGHVPAWATAANDLGSVSPARRLDNLHLILMRAPEVQAAFEQLLADQQNPASPRFHQWLTPQQNATQYGVAAADVTAATDWLKSQGLSVDDVASGGVFVTFSGPASVVENAFSTSLHNFSHQNAARYAPTTEPAIPVALTSVIQGVAGLSEQMAETHSHAAATADGATVNAAGNVVRPLYNSGTSNHYISPGDFNTIYNINAVYGAGFTGTGYRVANLIDSRIAAADITGFNSVFGLSVAQPNTVLVPGGTDPGISTSSEGEATLDVQRILGTAPGAGVDLVVMSSLSFSNIYSALQYAVGTLNDPVVNMSFGACDSGNVASQEATFDSYFKTGAAQGISFFVSSGDNAAGGCDGNYSTIPAAQVLATNVICASGYATCVGGTEFAEGTGTYWAGSNSSARVSATGYIPEGAWDEPTFVSNGTTTYQASGGGGGVTKFPKPSWQAGVGVPADGLRDVPDVSFTSAYHDGYLVCQVDMGNDCSAGTFKYIIFGTSAASPSMAGIAALLDQKMGGRQGNLNPLFYKLAATVSNNVFHDTTVASSGIGACSTATPSICNNSTPAANALAGGLAGYAVTAGYDLATGLGSMDVANFLTAAAASTVSTMSTTVALATSANPMTTAQTVTFTATVSGSSATPTGTVQFYSNGVALGAAVTLGSTGAATTPALTFATAGTYAITAVYSGDAAFQGATSSALALVVNVVTSAPAAGFTLVSSPSSLSFVSGATAANAETILLTSVNGFAGPVALSCTISVSSATVQPGCVLTPTSVNLAAGGTASAVATISTSAATSGARSVAAGAMVALLVCVMPFRRRRAIRSLAAVVLLLGGLAAVSGCGSGVRGFNSLSSSAGSYTVTVTGTGTSAGSNVATTASTSFTVTVN